MYFCYIKCICGCYTHVYSLNFAARLLRSWVRIPPGAWIFVCCECRVLSGRGLCDELITRPEKSYRLCCVVVCDLETSRIGAPYIYIYDISNLRFKWCVRIILLLQRPAYAVLSIRRILFNDTLSVYVPAFVWRDARKARFEPNKLKVRKLMTVYR